jgi:MoxR-like ATPase
MSTVDARTVTVKEAVSRVTRALKKDRPLFIWGPPGVGKSELCQYIVDSGELGKAKL